MKYSMKIFGIGLSRTGTKSLTAALQMLGYRIVHFPHDRKTINELTSGRLNFTLLKDKDGITDITVASYYAQLDKQFPKSKFILTTRDKDSWMKSVEKHFRHNPLPKIFPDVLPNQKARRFLRNVVYGSHVFNRERMSYVFDMHHKNVIHYFENRPDKLLVIDIPSGEGWEKLCPYLNKPIVSKPFPRV